MTDVPRPKYPRPQLERSEWTNCNGEWEFETDPGRSGRERGLPTADSLDNAITVPFPPESSLSSVGETDFLPAVWYRREVELPADYFEGRVRLHFGAVDYEAEIWVNGESVGTHRGGYTPFALDVTDAASPGTNEVTVCAEDDTRSPLQPSRKQCRSYQSRGASYTRVTGIWQTVWVEPVPETYVEDLRLTGDPSNGTVSLRARLGGDLPSGRTLAATAAFDGEAVGAAEAAVEGRTVDLAVDLSETHRWWPEDPALYDLTVELDADGAATDAVESYVGLRSVSVGADGELHLNGEPYFQRLVLDQGYYPEGVYTAPPTTNSAATWSGPRRWGSTARASTRRCSSPASSTTPTAWATSSGASTGTGGWTRTTPRRSDASCPSGRRPWNGTSATPRSSAGVRSTRRRRRSTRTPSGPSTGRRSASTRPVIDSSGWHHVETDVVDTHDYDQDPESFRARYERVRDGESIAFDHPMIEGKYGPETSFVSEYGGTLWDVADDDVEVWGHGDVDTEAEFLDRVAGLTAALLENPTISAFCYTQLYDIEQERNGLYTYDREPKFDPETMREIFRAPAAVED